jgi:hypothetical protein
MGLIDEARAFRAQIEGTVQYAPDEGAEQATELFPLWAEGAAYTVDHKVRYSGLLYRCVQAHASQAGWTPDVTPAMWVRTSTEDWSEWILPAGAHDAYAKGAKVSHSAKHWTSDVDANVWEPGVYGWTEV